MNADTIIFWTWIALGTELAMTLVFDRDRLLRSCLVGGMFWGAYVLCSLAVR